MHNMKVPTCTFLLHIYDTLCNHKNVTNFSKIRQFRLNFTGTCQLPSICKTLHGYRYGIKLTLGYMSLGNKTSIELITDFQLQ